MGDWLTHYRWTLQRALAASVSAGLPNAKIRAAAVDAVTGGKMLRSSIVVDIGHSLTAAAVPGAPPPGDLTPCGLHVALAVECIHAASLVLDDFTEFDDDAERRGKPSLHIAHGRQASLLAVVGLFSHAMACIGKQRHLAGDTAACDLAEAAAKAVQDCADGQLVEIQEEDAPIEAIMAKKTGALFVLSFLSGWLAGGGEVSATAAVVAGGEAFGLMFQVVDDVEDVEHDGGRGSRNYVLYHGLQSAVDFYLRKRVEFKAFLKNHGLESPFMEQMVSALDDRVVTGCAAAIKE